MGLAVCHRLGVHPEECDTGALGRFGNALLRPTVRLGLSAPSR
jgi:hypothetical protein